jgi:hypothetical protein
VRVDLGDRNALDGGVHRCLAQHLALVLDPIGELPGHEIGEPFVAEAALGAGHRVDRRDQIAAHVHHARVAIASLAGQRSRADRLEDLRVGGIDLGGSRDRCAADRVEREQRTPCNRTPRTDRALAG